MLSNSPLWPLVPPEGWRFNGKVKKKLGKAELLKVLKSGLNRERAEGAGEGGGFR